MRWLELEVMIEGKESGKVWVNLDNIKATSITEIEILNEPKNKIIVSKVTINKKYLVNLIMDDKLRAIKVFDNKKLAEDWQKDYVLNA